MAEKIHYVYLHRYASGPHEGEVFYVGKGCEYRIKRKQGRNIMWTRIVNKYGFTYEYYAKELTEVCAMSLERIVIAKFRSLGCNLVNLTDGGGGMNGWSPNTIIPVRCSNGMIFDRISAAARWIMDTTGVNANAGRISHCCQGIRNSAYGYTWSFLDSKPKEYIRPDTLSAASRMKAVLCSNGMRFESLIAAVEWLKLNGNPKADKSAISMCCNEKSKTAYKLKWEYEKAPA